MGESELPPKRDQEDYPSALSARIGFLLARTHTMAREEADRALAEVGLTMKGYAALATLVADGPTSQQRLSQRIGMDPATMVDVIDALEESGYILRRRNPQDRRQYALQTTARGRQLYSRALQAIVKAERHTVRSLDPEEARLLLQLLGRVAARNSSQSPAPSS
jgi:DNA-binding MarR family transcriptional regulator